MSLRIIVTLSGLFVFSAASSQVTLGFSLDLAHTHITEPYEWREDGWYCAEGCEVLRSKPRAGYSTSLIAQIPVFSNQHIAMDIGYSETKYLEVDYVPYYDWRGDLHRNIKKIHLGLYFDLFLTPIHRNSSLFTEIGYRIHKMTERQIDYYGRKYPGFRDIGSMGQVGLKYEIRHLLGDTQAGPFFRIALSNHGSSDPPDNYHSRGYLYPYEIGFSIKHFFRL